MKISSLVLALVVAAEIGGCASIGSEVTLTAKPLNDTVTGNIYISPDRSFEVQVPYLYKSDSVEWKSVRVLEGADGLNTTWVIFGPAAADRIEYHAVLIKRPIRDTLEHQATRVFNNQAVAYETRLGKSLTQAHRENMSLKGNAAAYAVFENDIAYLVELVLDLESRFAHFEALVLRNGSNSTNSDIRSAIRSRQLTQFNEFVESFKPLPLQ